MDPLDHAENINTKYAMYGQTSCLPFWLNWNPTFSSWFDFHLIRLDSGSDSDYAGKKLCISCQKTKPHYRINEFDGMMPNCV